MGACPLLLERMSLPRVRGRDRIAWAREGSDVYRTLIVPVALLLSACQVPTSRNSSLDAQRIYHGGAVVTLDQEQRVAAALAVRDGRILAVGETQAVFAHRGPDTEMVDLRGRAILPGFVDAHGHLTSVARMAATANVASPPVGPVEDLDDLVEVMRAAAAGGEAPVGDWLVGAGYDDALLAEGRHPNRDDLDRISPDQPVALFHVSLHFVTLNSKALERIGVGADTPDPEGGLIRRRGGARREQRRHQPKDAPRRT